jgi:hypothetical protein
LANRPGALASAVDTLCFRVEAETESISARKAQPIAGENKAIQYRIDRVRRISAAR